MALGASRKFCAALCCLCATAAPAFPDKPSDSHEPSYGASSFALRPQKSADKSIRPHLGIEVSEERITALVAAHEKVLKEFSTVLEERDAFFVPTVRARLAAKALIKLEHRGVLPFLAHNIAYSEPLPFSFTAQPVLEASPYLLALIQHDVFGARAIVEAVARRPENSIRNREWMLYGYALVNI